MIWWIVDCLKWCQPSLTLVRLRTSLSHPINLNRRRECVRVIEAGIDWICQRRQESWLQINHSGKNSFFASCTYKLLFCRSVEVLSFSKSESSECRQLDQPTRQSSRKQVQQVQCSSEGLFFPPSSAIQSRKLAEAPLFAEACYVCVCQHDRHRPMTDSSCGSPSWADSLGSCSQKLYTAVSNLMGLVGIHY